MRYACEDCEPNQRRVEEREESGDVMAALIPLLTPSASGGPAALGLPDETRLQVESETRRGNKSGRSRFDGRPE